MLNFKLTFNDQSTKEFVLNNDRFIFHYGLSKSRDYSNNIALQVYIETGNLGNINIIENFLFKIYPYLTQQSEITKIQILIERANNPEGNITYIFNKNEIQDFMMGYVNNDQDNKYSINFKVVPQASNEEEVNNNG